jgi:mono/diheme cytochrome c family protein
LVKTENSAATFAVLFREFVKSPVKAEFSTILAGLALGLVGLGLVSGAYEALSYQANLASGYASVAEMRSNPTGLFVAAIHYWTSAGLLLVSALLLLALLWQKGYADKQRWFGSLGMCVASFALQVTGNLLPLDRHGVQTAVVESGIGGAAPGIGSTARGIMLAGTRFDAETLARWWMGHSWILPVVLVTCSFFVLRGFRPKSAWLITSVALVLLLGKLVPAPLGLIATKTDYDQYNATVSWYTWPFHGLMNAFAQLSSSAGWVGSVAVPTLLFLILLLLPWIGQRVSVTAVRSATASILVVGLGISALFGGRVAALTGNRDPALATVKKVSGTPSTDPRIIELVAQGHQAFNSVGCASCHGRDGVNGDGGPDLSGEWKQHSDPQWFVKLIHNPKAVTPSATMPAFPKLPDDQVLAIGTYLSQPPKR